MMENNTEDKTSSIYSDVYHQDIWYETSHLDLKTKKKLLVAAKGFSFGDWNVDILDCTKSWARQSTDMDWKTILSLLDNKCHFVVVYRKGYESWKQLDPHRWCLELGFSTYNSPTYYLWVYVKDRYAELIIKNFKLKERKI